MRGDDQRCDDQRCDDQRGDDVGLRSDRTGVPRTAMRRPRWTAAMRETFFGHLAGEGDVNASAAAIGLTAAQVRHPLRTDPAFAAQWDGAIRASYRLLEARLIDRLLAGERPTDAREGGAALAPEEWERALKLLAHDKARRTVRGSGKAPVRAVASRDETDRVILARLAALDAARASATIDGERE